MVRRKKAIRRRKTPRRVVGASGKKSPKIGAWLRGARAIDVISGPAQGSLASRGFDMKDIGQRYAGKFAGGSQEAMITTVKGVGTGMVRAAVTSKSGA